MPQAVLGFAPYSQNDYDNPQSRSACPGAEPSQAIAPEVQLSSSQVAILEQEERKQERCSTVQHAIAECRQYVAGPGNERTG